VTRRGGKERAISRADCRSGNLAAQDIELVTEDHQLDVLDVGAASAAHEQAEQRADCEVSEGEEHGPDPPKLRPERSRPE
jgi:hypothetical protein